MKPADTYKTIEAPFTGPLFKEKKSKFYGYAYPVAREDEVRLLLAELRKLYPSSNHICYAWQLGISEIQYRTNDDGEPNNSAGMPIYGQIQSFNVTNVLVAVVRLFGGTKLGVGGLISAYRESAKLTLESAQIITRVLKEEIRLSFSYADMDSVMRFIKKNKLEIVSQELTATCELTIAVRLRDMEKVLNALAVLHKIVVEKNSAYLSHKGKIHFNFSRI